jgi:2,4-dienoyl-CoA reductase-like NADH-dependent reductase (Old Yellow Enzyme family)
MVTGGITEGAFAEKVLKDGHADLIGVGRALLRDPDWVMKARARTLSEVPETKQGITQGRLA